MALIVTTVRATSATSCALLGLLYSNKQEERPLSGLNLQAPGRVNLSLSRCPLDQVLEHEALVHQNSQMRFNGPVLLLDAIGKPVFGSRPFV
jgi:hypothetical protein